MKAVESEGASVQEAVDRALLLMGLKPEEVSVSVLREPAGGDGASTALVRVQTKQLDAGEPTTARFAPEPPETEPVAVSGETRSSAPPASDGADDEAGDDIPLTEEEGARADRAGDFLEDLFEHLGLDCYVEVAADRVEGKILIDIAGPDTAFVIGRKGQMLDAVELILGRAMDNLDGGGLRIALDAEGYRVRRTQKLRELAAQQAAEVDRSRRSIALEPMTARDRRTIHIALKHSAKVHTRSVGEGPDRHIIIEPAGR